ncbi:MAG: germination protein YpeB [Clostridia bacterium]
MSRIKKKKNKTSKKQSPILEKHDNANSQTLPVNQKAVENLNNNKLQLTKPKRQIGGLIAMICIISITLLGIGVWLAISINNSNQLALSLENSYQKSFYDLVDNVDNMEAKLSKIVVSKDKNHTKKLLFEVSKNASRASESISILPLSIGGVEKATSFINQIDGYCTSLTQKLENNQKLSLTEEKILKELLNSITKIGNELDKISRQLKGGTTILSSSLSMNGDFNKLTLSISGTQSSIDYPTMIYDGPFSESSTNPVIKGLSGDEVNKDQAETLLKKHFPAIKDESIKYQGESKGKFITHDFNFITVNNNSLFAQVTKIGGKLLTVSGYSPKISTKVSVESCISNAIAFCKNAGFLNVECVWNDSINGQAILNIAPKKDNIILYPDLIKIKVEQNSGEIIGFEATSYYTNHKQRTLAEVEISRATAEKKVVLDVETYRLVLAPLDYNREVLCHEFKCKNDTNVYYIFINAVTGVEENILMVVEGSDGNLLV